MTTRLTFLVLLLSASSASAQPADGTGEGTPAGLTPENAPTLEADLDELFEQHFGRNGIPCPEFEDEDASESYERWQCTLSFVECLCDADGRILAIVERVEEYGDVYTQYDTFVYDEVGNIASQGIHWDGDVEANWIYVFQYDDEGNRVVKWNAGSRARLSQVCVYSPPCPPPFTLCQTECLSY